MAIDALRAYLERETAAEAATLLAAARAEAAACEANAVAEADHRRTAELARLEREAADRVRDALVSVRREQRRRILAARAATLARIFAGADDLLRRTPVEGYRHRVATLAAEAAGFLEGCPARLICPTEAAATIASVAADWPSIRVTPADDAAPGVLARADDGSVVVDNTLTERLARGRETLAIRLAARLDGGDDAVG